MLGRGGGVVGQKIDMYVWPTMEKNVNIYLHRMFGKQSIIIMYYVTKNSGNHHNLKLSE